MFAEDNTFLDRPTELADLISRLSAGDDPSTLLTTDEACSLSAAMSQTPTPRSAIGKLAVAKAPFTPRGEGGSGNPKAPDMGTQYSSVHDHDDSDLESGTADDQDNDDLQSDGSDQAPVTPTVAGGFEPVSSDDFNMAVECIDQKIDESTHGVEQKVMAVVSQLKAEVELLKKGQRELNTKVSNLQVALAGARPTATVTGPGVTTSGPQPGQVQAQPVTPKPVGPAKSVAGVGGPHVPPSPVQTFLGSHPRYPKVQIVRKQKLALLAKDLGKSVPDKDVTPAEWNQSGLEKIFGA